MQPEKPDKPDKPEVKTEGKMISSRRVKLNKTQQTILAIVSISSFIIIFSLVSTKSLISQIAYQNKVKSAQQHSLNQFNADSRAAGNLISSYETFVSPPTNIIGGTVVGTANNDGTNSKIVLDALPDKYDFPAVATAVQNLLTMAGLSIQSISGTDTGGNTSLAASAGTSTVPITTDPSAVPIPFTFTLQGAYSNEQVILQKLLSSILPINVESINFSGSDNSLLMSVTAETFYQPETGIVISTETIK